MPLYTAGTAVALYPEDFLTLFNGTETPGASVKSRAFARGPAPSQTDAGSTFQVVYAGAADATILIQGSNTDVDADYQTLYTSLDLQLDAYTDIGRFAFYRAVMSEYTSGGMPVVTVQR